MLLERLESNFAKRQRAGVANGQMAQLDLKKHGGGMMMLASVIETRKLWKERKQGNTSREKYLEAEKVTRAVYNA